METKTIRIEYFTHEYDKNFIKEGRAFALISIGAAKSGDKERAEYYRNKAQDIYNFSRQCLKVA